MDWKVRTAKRVIDILLASVGLALTAPLLPLVALAIKLDSRGPVVFRQRRAGSLLGTETVDGVTRFRFAEFDMLKFRTMRTDAEKATGPVLATRTDPRVTQVGRFLRRTRLDELPQFWNVLCGQMSLIGPRPERPEILDNLARAIPFFEERMRGVKPGITGLAQINLAYNGEAPVGSPIAVLQDEIVNPFDLEDAVGAEADGMRLKLLFDLAYTATLEDFGTFVRAETEIVLRTPVVMLRGRGY